VEAALVPLDPHGRKSFMTTPSDRIGSRAWSHRHKTTLLCCV
jgi:hypothetical protein